MLYDLTRDALGKLVADHGDSSKFRSDQIWHGIYNEFKFVDEITTLPKSLRTKLSEDENFHCGVELATKQTCDKGLTTKYLWRLHDGATVETVLMHYPEHRSRRTTVCISTQAGCAMGCGFCATGQAGFQRHLSGSEIVAQVVMAWRDSLPDRVTNVVFMGMGEPLANEDNTWRAIRSLNTDLGISARKLTVSTVGVVPGIKKLRQRDLPVNLAVSLHAANNPLRNELVPINKTYPLEVLFDECSHWIKAHNRRLSIEWAMIADTNDSPNDAEELASFVLPLRAHVNLIPLNPTPGWSTVGSDQQTIRHFEQRLTDLGVNVTVRQNRGTTIDAACGQLRANHQLEIRPRRRALGHK